MTTPGSGQLRRRLGGSQKPIQRLLHLCHRRGRQVYWIQIDGCQNGLEWKGTPVKKSWTILTTNRELWLTLNKRCDWTHEDVHCRGEVAKASSYYPIRRCAVMFARQWLATGSSNTILWSAWPRTISCTSRARMPPWTLLSC